MKASPFIRWVSLAGVCWGCAWVANSQMQRDTLWHALLWKRPQPIEDGEALQEFKLTQTRRQMPQACWPSATQQANWFALYTTSRHEKRVAQHLSHRDIECYLPLYRSRRKWSDGSRVTLELPLFPGYVFVHIRRNERKDVLAVPGALAVVEGTGGEPASLPDATIDALRSGLDSRSAMPYPLMAVGRRVRVRSGALAGLEGFVVRNKNGFRVVMTLEHIMKSYAVEVDLEDLELLTPGELSHAGVARSARQR
jgi:transcription antitermination factor NusG